MKKYILVLILIFVFIENVFAGSPGTYREHIYRMSDKIDKFLISNNYCADEGDCNIKEYFFYEPISEGAVLNFYTITIKKDIEAIINIAKEEYLNNDKKIFIELNFYKKSHRNTIKKSLSISGDKPIKTKKFIHKDSFLFFSMS